MGFSGPFGRPGPGTANSCRIGTCAVAFVDIDLHLPGIDRL
jgi:hypothetical protein